MPREVKAVKGRSAAEARRIRDGLQALSAQALEELDGVNAAAAGLRRDDLLGDDVDAAALTADYEHQSTMADGLRQRIVQLEHALERLAVGGYGLCEGCGDPIAAKRLVAFPGRDVVRGVQACAGTLIGK